MIIFYKMYFICLHACWALYGSFCFFNSYDARSYTTRGGWDFVRLIRMIYGVAFRVMHGSELLGSLKQIAAFLFSYVLITSATIRKKFIVHMNPKDSTYAARILLSDSYLCDSYSNAA
jgi:hypothetical protein